ncbi:MAG: hypothetical protein R3266_10210, partial [Gemmatimonadota bacterium]|nr:hypothetical protein [Gemmatimonadota bacterium]
MPLTVVRSDSNARLWEACRTSFLDRLGDEPGRTRHPAHLWLGHRTQRDLLLEAAESRGLRGWLAPPFSFFSELPARFALRGRPLRPLTGRMLLARIAARTARSLSFEAGDGPGRSRLIDRALSELLPEGIPPDELEAALGRLPADDFTRGRNRWLTETYRAYLSALEERGRFDPRSVHALVSERIRSGGLREAIAGAEELHVYGPTSLRGRRRLFESLARQRQVDVRVYLPPGGDGGEWSEVANRFDDVAADGPDPDVAVQPAPDGVREAAWVARTVKSLLIEAGTEPHRIAVVARSGREDTGRLYEALRRAGVPGSVRSRARLADVPALRAILHLFEAVGRGWTGASLRPVLKSPYFDVEIDLRPLDLLESRTRPEGLPAWIEGLERLAEEARSERGWILRRSRVTAAVLERDLPVLRRLAREVAPLEESRPEAAWIAATRELLRGRPLGMRERVSEPVGDRWDLVRLDQRGTLALDSLLGEWGQMLPGRGEVLEPGAWHDRLRRILRSNELALSTPLQRGVQILEAHEAALTPFEHAFIVHVNDGVFPPPGAGSLFDDEETARLGAMGLPFAPRDLRLEREERLWRACTGSTRVTVSYWTA